MGITSYAQNFEDVLLNRVFGGLNYGFYVDIGAYHPVDDSVTKAFYDRGWSGLNIEPGAIFEELAVARPRDINLNLAVYNRPGEVAFVQHPGWYAGLSHVTEGQEPRPSGPVSQPEVSLRQVKCDTLTNIIDAHAGRRPIAFLKIDAEGAEAAIIASTDWRAIRPTVLLIEATLPRSNQLDNQEWEPLLLDQGYIRAYFDGLNCFYLPEERRDLLQHFAIPVNTLDGFVRYDPALAKCREQLQAVQQQLAALVSEKAAVSAELAAQTAQNAQLQARQAADLELLRAHGRSFDELRQQYELRLAATVREHDGRLADLQTDHSAALAGFYQQLADERDRHASLLRDHQNAVAALTEVAAAAEAERDRTTARLAKAAQQQEILIAHAYQLHRLARELAWQGGPRALRSVLPLARLIRRLSFTKPPALLPEEAVIAAMDRLAPSPPSVAGPPAAPPVASPPAQPRGRRLARRLALVAYTPIRPVARSIAWRTRSFLTDGLRTDIVSIDLGLSALTNFAGALRDEQVQSLQQSLAMLQQVLDRLEAMRVKAAQVPSDTSVSQQLAEFAKMLDSTLLTLALNGAAERGEPYLAVGNPVGPEQVPKSAPVAVPSFDFNMTLHNARGAMLREMPPGAHRLLSAGCAGTWYFNWIEQCYGPVHEHVGIEFYSPRPDGLPDNVTWIANTASNMEAVEDASCDLVFSGQNMEHLWGWEVSGFLMEAARVLKTGGHLVVDSPNRDITSALNWSHPEHTIELSVPEIHRLLEFAGFDVTKEVGIWLCRDPATSRMLPLSPDGTETHWSAAERLMVAQAHPEDSFVWWLEGRRNGRAPDRAAIEALLDAAYRHAWPERVRRMSVVPGRKVVSRDGEDWVMVPPGDSGVVLYGPYVPLRAGRHRITFAMEPDSGSAGILARCDVCIGSDATVLQQQEVTPGTRTVTFEVELAAMEFGGQFRCISVAGGFSVRRLVLLEEELA